MSSWDNQEDNPYRAPTTEPGPPPDMATGTVDRELVKKFRQQIHALGAFWIFLGSVGALIPITGIDLSAPADGLSAVVILVLLAVFGLIWLAVGVLSCFKQVWAVYVGLVLSYLSLVGQTMRLNICALVILVVVILQAHRVIGFARQMRAAGIPLTAK